MILRQQQAGRVGGELTEGDAADVAALLQLRDVFGRGVLEPELAFVHRLRQQRGIDTLRSDARLNSVSAVIRRSGVRSAQP